MEIWQRDVAQRARKDVAHWFVWSATGAAFLPGDGRALPLSDDELLAIRASAETKAVAWRVALENRMIFGVVLIVCLFTGGQSLASSLASPWKEGAQAAAYAIYATHGAWMLYEVWSSDREFKTLRAAIALSLRGRVPLDPVRAEVFNRGVLARVAFAVLGVGLLVWNFAAEQVAHLGFDLIGWVPAWVWLAIVVAILAGTLYLRWVDRANGVGALPPEDLATRVRNRLDRERLGR
jgi:hypothetical protein